MGVRVLFGFVIIFFTRKTGIKAFPHMLLGRLNMQNI